MEARRQIILSQIEQSGTVRVADLSSHLQVSEMTIRRDLERLEAEGLLRRTHGGAVWKGVTPEPPAQVRNARQVQEKERIGRTAAAMVADGEAVLLDSGSTTAQVARSLRERRGLTVVTNDIYVATQFADVNGITVIVPGGVLSAGSFALVGPDAERFLGRVQVDKAFIAAGGVSIEHGLTVSSPLEASVKRIMLATAQQVILCVDHTKIGKSALVPFGQLKHVHSLVTDVGAVDQQLVPLREAGIEVIVV